MTKNKEVKIGKSADGNAVTFLEMLFLLFLGLKLADKIDWSWWWVFAPIWMPVAIVVVILAVAGLAWLLRRVVK